MYKRERISGLVVAAVILVFAWISYATRPATMSSAAAPPPQSPNVAAQPTPPASASPTPVAAPAAVASPAQLKYETVRYVAPNGQPRFSDLDHRVKHFGDDVTVRYFTPRTAVIKTADGSEVHQVSDDVTVRYFKPKNTAPQAEPVAGGSPKTVTR